MGIFDNASSVVIGNKEVQSIVRVSDGAVLYQKAPSHSYALAFSSASYQTDSSGDVTVSVTLTDNGVAVSGETVSFSDGSSVYTGITNNLGVASCNLNYHSNGSVTASYSNITATASIVSNYVPPSVTLTEPITYSFIDNTSDGWFTAYLVYCGDIGDPVDTIQGLYNPPLTPQEIFEGLLEQTFDCDIINFADGEQQDEPYMDIICYAIATYDGETFFTIDYSTTDGTDIIITVTD